ncbi:MAG: hypothetical protein K1X85_02955 [Ignavibacteria bacterium]|nr:hypothetical protein [Ignavibacteria bacterium]
MKKAILPISFLTTLMLFCFQFYANAQSVGNTSGFHSGKLNFSKSTEVSSDTSRSFGTYTPGAGFTVADTKMGSMNIRIFSYIRYLNQKGLEAEYVDSFGDTATVKRRNDIQLNKVTINFQGWLLDEKFRYLFYAWTNNTAQGQVSQVVIAGSLSYKFNDYIKLSGGVGSLPGTRSTEGTFPFWVVNDNRLIADEFFRPSYTMGFWIDGMIAKGLMYQGMIGNNLSQLGIDAGQLDDDLSTVSVALKWFPTTGEFGRNSSYGDFENHQKVATRLAGHFTISNEDRQSQPNSDAFDNTQIRLSDGSVIFKPGLFGPGVNIKKVQYRMTNFDIGMKYKGFSLDAGYFYRWLDKFGGDNLGSLGFTELTDDGFLLLSSYMVVPQFFQIYGGYSKIFGNYGNPWGARGGINIHPWKDEVARINLEYLYLDKSPVGGLSLPYPVGAKGSIVHLDFLVNF